MRQEFCHLQIQVVSLTNVFLHNQTHVPLEDPIKSWLCFFSYSEANDLPLPNPALGIITSKKGARMLVAWGWALDKAGLGWIFCLQKTTTLFPGCHPMEMHGPFSSSLLPLSVFPFLLLSLSSLSLSHSLFFLPFFLLSFLCRDGSLFWTLWQVNISQACVLLHIDGIL